MEEEKETVYAIVPVNDTRGYAGFGGELIDILKKQMTDKFQVAIESAASSFGRALFDSPSKAWSSSELAENINAAFIDAIRKGRHFQTDLSSMQAHIKKLENERGQWRIKAKSILRELDAISMSGNPHQIQNIAMFIQEIAQ